MRKVKWQYCARCENCKKRGDKNQTDGFSIAADIRDGVMDNVCVAQVDPYDGGPLNLDREVHAYIQRHINSGHFKLKGSIIMVWDEEIQGYKKFTTVSKLAEQFLWEPRQCPAFELARRLQNWNNRTNNRRTVYATSM